MGLTLTLTATEALQLDVCQRLFGGTDTDGSPTHFVLGNDFGLSLTAAHNTMSACVPGIN